MRLNDCTVIICAKAASIHWTLIHIDTHAPHSDRKAFVYIFTRCVSFFCFRLSLSCNMWRSKQHASSLETFTLLPFVCFVYHSLCLLCLRLARSTSSLRTFRVTENTLLTNRSIQLVRNRLENTEFQIYLPYLLNVP